MIEIFPPELLNIDREKEMVAFLRRLLVPPMLKKQALIAWCKYVSRILTPDLVAAVLGADIEKIR